MPKYFDDERKLPFTRIAATSSQLSEQWLLRQLAQHESKVSLRFQFEGFEKDCLGYVFQRTADTLCPLPSSASRWFIS